MISTRWIVLTGVLFLAFFADAAGTADDGAHRGPAPLGRLIVEAAGVRQGLCVDLDCGDGTLAAELDAAAPLLVQGLTPDPNTLVIAGVATKNGTEHHEAYMIGAADGQLLNKIPLPAPVVYDGMAAAQGRLFVSLQNGEVLCLGSR